MLRVLNAVAVRRQLRLDSSRNLAHVWPLMLGPPPPSWRCELKLLHAVSTCGRCLLVAWWLGPKISISERERDNESYNDFKAHIASLLSNSLGQDTHKCPLRFKGRGHSPPYDGKNECQ